MRVFLLAAVLAGCAHSRPPVAVGPRYDAFAVEQYSVSLRPDLATKEVSGTETIAFRAATPLRRLELSANALTIDEARIGNRAVRVTRTGDTLGFELGEPLARGARATLTLAFHGVPARGVVSSDASLYTSYFACDWMICRQDSPGDKALFALDLRVPAGMTSLAPGRLVDVRPGPDGSEVHRWRTDRPYSAYLFGFAFGRFARAEEHEGGVELVTLSDVAEPAELRQRFGETGAMVRFLAAKAGTPLPSGRYTQLLVAGDEAQEAATYAVLGKDALPAHAGDPAEDWAIVHELAHQWWGNLVTCDTWQDFWLNEGITTFMTAAWKEQRYGRAAYEAELDVARGRLAKARERGYDKPLAWAGTYPSLGLRRAVQYSKGALFMAHLRGLLGDAAFWAGLAAYTQAHAGKVVTSIDFERALEASSGKDLRAVFAAWVFTGTPG